jgi:hypothetical protein
MAHTIDPRLCMFIYHGSSVGNSRTNFVESWHTNRIELLQEYLCDALDDDRTFIAVCSKSGASRDTRFIKGKLGGLADLVGEIDYGTSICIPPSKDLGQIDRKFLDLLLPETAPTHYRQ